MKSYFSEQDVLACLPMSKAVELVDGAFRSLADGTAITREAALDRFRQLPGMALLDPAHTALVLQEVQNGVVGSPSALPASRNLSATSRT